MRQRQGLDRTLPRAQQCCANCTAFIPVGPMNIRTPDGQTVTVLSGECHAGPRTIFPASVQTGSVLEIKGPQVQQGFRTVFPPTYEAGWCRDGWEHNPEVKVRTHDHGMAQQRKDN